MDAAPVPDPVLTKSGCHSNHLIRQFQLQSLAGDLAHRARVRRVSLMTVATPATTATRTTTMPSA